MNARTLAGALVRRVRARQVVPKAAPERTPVVGVVEEFTERLVLGWIAVPADAPPVQVTLCLGRLELSTTYATADGAMSGAGKKRRRHGGLPGPKKDRRNPADQVRTFSFRVIGIWSYVRRGTRITVRVDGRPLPIVGHGLYLNPPEDGRFDVPELRRRMAEGFMLHQYGGVSLSKKIDTAWQAVVIELHERVGAVLRERHGIELFVVYGTLLGVVRENGFIGHDSDYDTAYVSHARTAREAADELEQVGLTLVEAGFEVEALEFVLHVSDPDLSGHRIDVFHSFFDADDRFRLPFGSAGRRVITRDDWTGFRDVPLGPGTVRVPMEAERVVEMLYGDDWRRPKPGFNWHIERRDWVPEAGLTTEQRTKVYWANFYSRTRYTAGSTFFSFVDARPDTPTTIIDIGCGDGRDACAFGDAGRTVLGLDQSPVGIANAGERAAALGVADRVRFRVCDVADVDDLGRAMDEVEQQAPGPVLFYLRFFLHAIPEDVQAGLMKAIATHARSGDLFAAEFRTDKDRANAKVHTRHYRRFQDASVFRTALQDEHGFEVLHFEEGTGLSPYQEEDPVLCRVVARRP